MKTHTKVLLISILIMVIATAGCTAVSEEKPALSVTNLENGVYLISVNSYVPIKSSSVAMYVGQSVSSLVAENPNMEYISLTPCAIDYRYVYEYIVVFRPKNPCNCTC